MGVHMHVERQPAGLSFVPEWPRHGFEQAGEGDFLRLDGDRAQLDLGEVEDVADQIEEVGSGAVNCPGELDLLGPEIAVRIIRESA